MSGSRSDATARLRAALPTVLAAVLALLLPTLLTTSSNPAASVAVGALAFALAALVHVGLRCGALEARTRTAACPTGDVTAMVLSGRATDPVHHPLRPRAPGPT